jgi:hypothetical protein
MGLPEALTEMLHTDLEWGTFTAEDVAVNRSAITIPNGRKLDGGQADEPNEAGRVAAETVRTARMSAHL